MYSILKLNKTYLCGVIDAYNPQTSVNRFIVTLIRCYRRFNNMVYILQLLGSILMTVNILSSISQLSYVVIYYFQYRYCPFLQFPNNICNCYVGCVDSKATKILAVAPCAVCACRERRVELSERGNNRTNRTRCWGQYSRSKRLFLTPPPCVRYCLLHNCPSLSPPHATTNPIVFALWPTPSSTIVWGLLPKMPISTVLRVKYLLFILPRVPTDSLYLTKTVFTYISFPPKFGIGTLDDVCKPIVV